MTKNFKPSYATHVHVHVNLLKIINKCNHYLQEDQPSFKLFHWIHLYSHKTQAFYYTDDNGESVLRVSQFSKEPHPNRKEPDLRQDTNDFSIKISNTLSIGNVRIISTPRGGEEGEEGREGEKEREGEREREGREGEKREREREKEGESETKRFKVGNTCTIQQIQSVKTIQYNHHLFTNKPHTHTHLHTHTLRTHTDIMHNNTHTHTLLPFLEWFLCFEVGKGKSLDSVYEILRNRMNRELKIEKKTIALVMLLKIAMML